MKIGAKSWNVEVERDGDEPEGDIDIYVDGNLVAWFALEDGLLYFELTENAYLTNMGKLSYLYNDEYCGEEDD